jgi:hypothetical protein
MDFWQSIAFHSKSSLDTSQCKHFISMPFCWSLVTNWQFVKFITLRLEYGLSNYKGYHFPTKLQNGISLVVRRMLCGLQNCQCYQHILWERHQTHNNISESVSFCPKANSAVPSEHDSLYQLLLSLS